MTHPVNPEEACGGRVRLVCPSCGAMSTLEPVVAELRIICSQCSYVRALELWEAGRKLHFPQALELVERHQLELWFTTNFRGHDLWALDEAHLHYLRRFVASTNRSVDFPSEPGARQLSDKFPAWLSSGQDRQQLVARVDRLLGKT